MMDRITDLLRIELVTLAAALQARGVPLIVGGGYGLLLRQEFRSHVWLDRPGAGPGS